MLTLNEICCHAIVGRTDVYGIDKLPLPDSVKANLKSYALTSHGASGQPNYGGGGTRHGAGGGHHGRYRTLKERRKKRPPDAETTNCGRVSRKSCVIS